MATSGTATFGPDFGTLFEEAYELAGMEMRTGYQLATAKRSLDLLMLEWANRGYNLWLVDDATVSTTAADSTYVLAADTVDVIEALITVDDTEYRLRRIPAVDYMQISNKATTGRPSSMWINRQLAAPVMTLWPTPDAVYTITYWRLRRVEDTGSGVTYTPDVPFRFLPALIAGLAHKLAAKSQDSTVMARVPFLEAESEKQFRLAADEDRGKASFF